MMLVAGCVTVGDEEPDTVRVQTWERRTTTIGDGPAVTTATYTDAQRAVEQPLTEQGNYWLNSATGPDCVLFLGSAIVDGDRRMVRLSSDCAAEFQHVTTWRLDGTSIQLFDAEVQMIGAFDLTTVRLYNGRIVMVGGSITTATLLRDI